MKKFMAELRRRGVIKATLAYLVVAWLIMQLADVIFPALGLPDWTITLVLALLALGLPMAVVLAWVFDLSLRGIERTGDAEEPPTTEPAPGEPVPGAKVTAGEQSIAVLPFPDFSAEQDQQHFCDGLTEELINVLTGIPGLRVASRTSSFAFRGENPDQAHAAASLGVAHVLVGSVRKSENVLRITAQLIDAATDSTLWSQTYNRELAEIFSIQDDIAAQILAALEVRLGSGPSSDPTTSDARAYEYFLQGRGYAITRRSVDYDRASALFEQAVEKDPGFVRAWMELAHVNATDCLFHGNDEAKMAKARDATARVLRLAPDQWGSYITRGYLELAEGNIEAAERDFLKAVERRPGDGVAYHWLGRTYRLLGEPEKAKANFSRATELNEDDWESPFLALQDHVQAGDQDTARRFAELGLARIEDYMKVYPDVSRAYYLGTSALVVTGDVERATAWAERALALSADDPATRYNVACFYATIGETDRALDLLENSVKSRAWIENDSELDSLRDHPRYRALIESLPG